MEKEEHGHDAQPGTGRRVKGTKYGTCEKALCLQCCAAWWLNAAAALCSVPLCFAPFSTGAANLFIQLMFCRRLLHIRTGLESTELKLKLN